MLKPTPSILESIKTFRLPSPIPFGELLSPVMAQCSYKDGQWRRPELIPTAPLPLMPHAKVFHYGQEIFEGMKAYFVEEKGPFLFRPEENWKRFNRSALRMAMPEVPRAIFMDTLSAITHYSRPLIPTQTGESLYLRPLMLATEESLGIAPPGEFLFLVIAAPCGDYFAKARPLKLWVERNYARACPRGVGAAKTGGNYAGALKSAVEVQGRGLDQPLWLDATGQEFVEEMSGMNFFCLVEGILYTPRLTDSILPGITRASILELAPRLSLEVREVSLKISRLLEDIRGGRCTEAFACGTAVVVTPISSLTDGEETYTLSESFGPMSQNIRTTLLDIQEGRQEGPSGWVFKVEDRRF